MEPSIPRKALASMPIVIAVIGTIANALTFCVCLRKNLRSKTSFIFLATISLFDTTSLYSFNFDDFVSVFLKTRLNDLSEIWCKISLFIEGSSHMISVWLMVE